jgi:transposase-like protein
LKGARAVLRGGGDSNAVSLPDRHYESEIILLCVRWYLRYSLSYRDLEATVLKVKQKVAWQADAKPHYP